MREKEEKTRLISYFFCFCYLLTRNRRMKSCESWSLLNFTRRSFETSSHLRLMGLQPTPFSWRAPESIYRELYRWRTTKQPLKYSRTFFTSSPTQRGRTISTFDICATDLIFGRLAAQKSIVLRLLTIHNIIFFSIY